MRKEIIISGFGGQGIMFMGKLILQAAVYENKFVTGIPAYGAEVRGGTAYCMLVISDSEIGSPLVEKPDICIVMNKPSLDKFASRLKKGGLLIVNKSLVGNLEYKRKDVNILDIEFTKIALDLGDAKVANMVALGACLSKDKFLKKESLLRALEELGKKEYFEINKKAIEKGYER